MNYEWQITVSGVASVIVAPLQNAADRTNAELISNAGRKSRVIIEALLGLVVGWGWFKGWWIGGVEQGRNISQTNDNSKGLKLDEISIYFAI